MRISTSQPSRLPRRGRFGFEVAGRPLGRLWASRLLLLAALLTATPAAACSREGNGAEPQPPANGRTLSVEAARAFAELPAISLSQERAYRTFEIDPARSRAAYVVAEELFSGAARKYGLEIGNATVVGETGDVTGVLQIEPSGPSIGTNRFAVYLPTLRTDQELRDAWIRENALESNRYPLALLTVTGFHDAPAAFAQGAQVEFRLQGELILRGVTLPTIWEVTAVLQGDEISGVMQTRLRMSDLGIDPPHFAGTLTVEDEFSIRIEFTAAQR